MIPTEFTGGWVRQGIAFGSQPPVEDATVWWLQAATQHADLRVPMSSTSAPTSFAGTTTWDGAALTWTRIVDLEDFGGLDSGTVEWDGPDLLESGTCEVDGRVSTYTERWVRLPGSEGPLWALRRGDARVVRTGDYAITIDDRRQAGGPFTATAWRRVTGQWMIAHTLPGAPLAPAPPEHREHGESEGWLPDDGRRVVPRRGWPG